MTITPLQIVGCILMDFVIGLYVGSFIQRRRDVKEMKLNHKLKVVLKKLLDESIGEGESK